jgi:hypothetical protein
VPFVLRTFLLLVAACFFHAPFASAQETRIALLIGNQVYDSSVGALKNPHKDIALVGAALAKQGFEVLPPVRDARRTEILGAVRDLVRRLNKAGPSAVGFIYYSGHGASEKDTNVNYLIPVDAKHPGTAEFWDESLKLDDILQLLDRAPAAAKFVVFDACRTELQLPSKDVAKGLLPVAEQRGMFIAFATAPGRTASDQGANGGPYAAALSAELAKPGLDHLNLFQNVKEAVLAASGGAQQPWESNGLARRIYLTGEPPSVAQVVEQNFWSIVKDSDNPSVLQTYLDRYPSGKFAEIARASIAEREHELRLRQAQREAEERQAEEERKAAEARRLEEAQRIAASELAEARRSEAARRTKERELAEQLKQVSEDAKLAKDAARAAEERSKAALRDAEEARTAAEMARKAQSALAVAEEQRNSAVREAEEAKRALEAARTRQTAAVAAPGSDKQKEETRELEKIREATDALKTAQEAAVAAEAQKQAAQKEAEEAKAALKKLKAVQEPPGHQQVASLVPPSDAQAVGGASQLSRYAALGPEDLAKEMQRELHRVGCEPGDADGKWGDKGKAALARFIKYTKVSVTADVPTPEALDTIAAQRVRICPLECGSGTVQVGDKCVAKPRDSSRRKAADPSAPPNAAKGYTTCGRNGCQWVPAGCTAIRHGGGGGLGGRIYCPGR